MLTTLVIDEWPSLTSSKHGITGAARGPVYVLKWVKPETRREGP